MSELLRIDRVTKSFGSIRALDRVTLKVDQEEMVGLMGPNGSGKTTLINVVSGTYKPDEGSVFFKGKRINGLKPWEIASMRLSRTFQIPRVFREMTVLENMLVAGLCHSRNRKKSMERALSLLEMVGLLDFRDEYGKTMSGGQQKLLEFVRALMPDPDLLLLDEPMLGVHPVLRERMRRVLTEMSEEGKAFLLISHELAQVLRICPRIIVLDAGRKIAEGSGEEISKDPTVIQAYIGE